MGPIDRRLSRLESGTLSTNGMTLATMTAFLQAFGHDNIDRLLAGEDGQEMRDCFREACQRAGAIWGSLAEMAAALRETHSHLRDWEAERFGAMDSTD